MKYTAQRGRQQQRGGEQQKTETGCREASASCAGRARHGGSHPIVHGQRESVGLKVVNLGRVFLSDGQGIAALTGKPTQLGEQLEPFMEEAGADAHGFRYRGYEVAAAQEGGRVEIKPQNSDLQGDGQSGARAEDQGAEAA